MRHVAWRLWATKICRDRRGQAAENLPEALRDLLDRSYKLYVRVARLDGLIDRDATG